MAELVAETGITRERGYAYFLKGAEVWRRTKRRPAGAEGEPELVWRGSFICDPEFLYFIDAKGNISRASKASLAAEEQQFADIHLEVAGTHSEPMATVVEAKVSSGAIEIALRTDFAVKSPEQGPGPALAVHSAGVELRSVGAASDAFLQTLATKYGLENITRKMKVRTLFSALGLRGIPPP